MILREIQNKIDTECEINVVQLTIRYCLKAMHYSIKKFLFIPTQRKDVESIAAKVNYTPRFIGIEEDNTNINIYF